MDGRQPMSADQHVNVFGHIVSTGAILGSMAGWLPPISALAALTWYLISIWETKTVQDFVVRIKAWFHRKKG